jgi:hypothetical protein
MVVIEALATWVVGLQCFSERGTVRVYILHRGVERVRMEHNLKRDETWDVRSEIRIEIRSGKGKMTRMLVDK